MKFQLIHIAALIAIFQSLFLSFFFITNRRGDSVNNKIFASLLLVFSLNIAYSFSQSEGMISYFFRYGKALYIMGQVSFLVSPLLYLYVKSLLTPNLVLQKKDLFHLLLFITAVTFLLIISFFPINNIWGFRISFIYRSIILIQDAVYIVLIFLLIKRNKIELKDFWWEGNAKISWLRIFMVGFILVWNVKMQGFIFFNVEALWEFCPYTESLYFLLIFLFLNIIIFSVLKRPELFSPIKRYESSEINNDDRTNYLAKLNTAMKTEKLYYDSKLTLPVLSQKLSIPLRHLSQIINEEFGKNFNDYINSFRIAESKRMLIDQENCKKGILEIAYSVGFNSKSSFYDAFKKETGMPPKQFRAGSLREI